MERVILHSDLNCFYASVESVLNPALANVPMAVCGEPEKRHGIILAKNELAKGYGVQTAETIWSAKKKCPSLVLAKPHHDIYAKYSKEINQIYFEYTDLVEPFGIDESWLDVTGSEKIFGDGMTIANTIRERIKYETGLTVSIGVSFNKTIAKLGSDLKKPDAITLIDREHFKEIVWGLPVESLLYVGKSVHKTLYSMQIRTIGQLANASQHLLTYKLGKAGGMLWEYANGIDSDPVKRYDEHHAVKSVSNGMTFSHDLYDGEDIIVGLGAVCDLVAERLRQKHLKCCTVQLSIKDENFVTAQRQTQLENPTQLSRDLCDIAMRLLRATWNSSLGIRSLTVSACTLVPEGQATQISFFDDNIVDEKQEKRERTMDQIRKKFGHDAITSGGKLASDIGLDKKE